MTRPLVTALALAAFAVSGCAAVGVYWYKEGATREDLEFAQKTCGEQTRDYDFALRTDDTTLNAERSTGQQQFGSGSGGIYRECMERSGWRRVRGEQPPRAS